MLCLTWTVSRIPQSITISRRLPMLPHFLLLLHSTERLDEWLQRPDHAKFRKAVLWTVVVITQNSSHERCIDASQRLLYIRACLPCPRVNTVNDRLRSAADVCFQWWLNELTHDQEDVVLLMEMDVLFRNVSRFLWLLANETQRMHANVTSAVTTMHNRDTIARFCAADHRLNGYCAPGAHYLNGVALYSPHRLQALGVLRSGISFGFDVDLGAHLRRIAPESIGVVESTMVCMLPLDNLERVIAWLRREPDCPAWHVFHYLWRREVYPLMIKGIQAYYENTTLGEQL